MDSIKSVMLEESIMQKDLPASAGSRILEGFISPFDSAVAEKLKAAGIGIAGRAGMDEFGIPGIGADESDTVLDSVSALASGKAEYALCNDVFGKARAQAPSNGLCYIHPTYGTVSRYGLIPAASSMDQIGVMCKDIAEGFRLLSVIAGNDSRDGAMHPDASYNYTPHSGKIRVAIPSAAWAGNDAALSMLESKFETKQIELEYFDLYKQIIYILSCAEICNNTNRYDGIKFGYRTKDYTGVGDLYVNTRNEALGRDVKLAAIMGAHVLSHDYYEPLYEKAMKLRRMIRDSLDFGAYDAIALPACHDIPLYDRLGLFALPVLAGLPSISMPFGNSGIQLIAGAKNENILFGAGEAMKQ